MDKQTNFCVKCGKQLEIKQAGFSEGDSKLYCVNSKCPRFGFHSPEPLQDFKLYTKLDTRDIIVSKAILHEFEDDLRERNIAQR